jgi:hypothetical protein
MVDCIPVDQGVNQAMQASLVEITDALIAFIPEDGSRLSNAELRAGVESVIGCQLSDVAYEAAKSHVIPMGLAEKVKGPGGGLRAAGSKEVQTKPSAAAAAATAISPGGPLSLSQLESHLWEAANILRGSPVDRSDWKSYILPLLIFKRICDQWNEENAAMLTEYGEDFADQHRFQLPEVPTGTMCAPLPRTSAQPSRTPCAPWRRRTRSTSMASLAMPSGPTRIACPMSCSRT